MGWEGEKYLFFSSSSFSEAAKCKTQLFIDSIPPFFGLVILENKRLAGWFPLASPQALWLFYGSVGPVSLLAQLSVGNEFCVKTDYIFTYDILVGSVGDDLTCSHMMMREIKNIYTQFTCTQKFDLIFADWELLYFFTDISRMDILEKNASTDRDIDTVHQHENK